jgi:hypothetical protein
MERAERVNEEYAENGHEVREGDIIQTGKSKE